MLELMPPFYFLTFAKVSVSVSKKFGLKKVSVSVSKNFSLKKTFSTSLKNTWSRKKSKYQSRKYLVSKKSLSIGLENLGLKKVSLQIWSQKKVFVTVSKKVLVFQYFKIKSESAIYYS